MSDGSKGTPNKPTLPKLCQDRVALVEKHYGAMCATFGSITRKIAKMRDRGDQLAKQVTDFANNETVSHSTSNNLKSFAVNLSSIQDYRDAEIHRLTDKVIKPLSTYGHKCKQIKGIIKKEQVGIKLEGKQRKNLQKVHKKSPGDAHSIAEIELQKATSDASIGIEGLNNHMALFEREKLTDLKKIMLDFVSVELVFHAKAVEHYSRCFENLATVDTDMDLDEFMRKLSLTQYHQRAQLENKEGVPMATTSSLGTTATSSAFASTGDYTTTEGSYAYPRDGTSSTMSASGDKHVRIQPQSMYADDVDDEDSDDGDDDEDDDDDEYTGRR